MQIREEKHLMDQDEVSLMRSEHVLSPRIEGLLSTQPSMEPVQEIRAVANKQAKDQLITMLESVVTFKGRSINSFYFVLLYFPYDFFNFFYVF